MNLKETGNRFLVFFDSELQWKTSIASFHGSATFDNAEKSTTGLCLMSLVALNMKFIMTDTQFAPLNSILLFILNILLANILPAEYSDEYPAGWHLVKKCWLIDNCQVLN